MAQDSCENPAEHTYFRWDKFSHVLDSMIATNAIFYIFYVDLICSNQVWWSVEKHFSHLTVDFDMEAAHEIARLKRDFEDKECYLIETDLGYIPEYGMSCLRASKKGRKLLL